MPDYRSSTDRSAADPPPSHRTGERKGRRIFGNLFIGILTLLVVAAGGYWYSVHDRAGAAPPPAPAPPTVSVSPPLQHEVVEWDEFTGQFAGVDFVEIRARVSGYLTSINFQDGQTVKKGDLLFVIDPRPFENALASAKAQQAQAQARFDLASRQVARASELRQRDFASQSSLDERTEEMRQAAGALDAAKVAIKDAELNLDFTRITAPMSGRIGRHEVSIGNLVTGGSGGATTLLTAIVSLDPIQFYFDMSEADYLAYQRAAASGKIQSTRDGKVPVYARLADETDWPREGRLDFIDNQVDRGAGTIRARAVFPNPDFFVTPGQFGRVRIPGSEPYQALLVPDAAVVTDQSRKIVMTVADDGTVVPKVIRPGPTYEGLRIVRSGLKSEDRLIINGLMRARPGVKVTPQAGEIKLSAGDRSD
jgi:membrane fusion protein, multidrug efflux system